MTQLTFPFEINCLTSTNLGFEMQHDGATWWSLNDTLFWIAKSNTPSSSEEAFDWLCDRRNFDDALFFSALAELVAALQTGEISAHASIDTAPVAPVATPFWTSTNFIPRWDDLLPPWAPIWPEVLILSEKTFRAEALLDHSEPSHVMIPDAASPNGKSGFYRLTTDVMLYRDDVLKLWPIKGVGDSVTRKPSKSRKQRDLTLQVARSMTMMTYKGLSLAESKQGLSYAKIAARLFDRWVNEGEDCDHEDDAVKKSVERYYKRNALPAESGIPGH